ncbi:MAG TPA: MEDS domain-containing protein [Terriglobales bacterium]|nr:MEDS domain-containing protein [Terriglobales bacterium]
MADVHEFEISCREVWREVSNYLDGDLDAKLRARIERHLKHCRHCTAVVSGTANTVRLIGDEQAFELPASFSNRLRGKLRDAAAAVSRGSITLGITDDPIELGTHVIHFWETQEEFRRGVRFLEIGLRDRDHGVLFGHEEANERVLRLLRNAGIDVGELIASGRLRVLPRELQTSETLVAIEGAFKDAMRQNASAIRYLGNLGAGNRPWPGGEDGVLELEARVTGLAKRFPCVMVCMYEVKALSGRMVMKGGFHTHPWVVCGHALHANSLYIPESQFLGSLHI